MWKIDWQEYTFRLSRTKLKSNYVSRQWAICTSDHSGVLWLEGLGLDTYQGEEKIKEAPSCMADTWTENECDAWTTDECKAWTVHEYETWTMNESDAWIANECEAWTTDRSATRERRMVRRMNDKWMRRLNDKWMRGMNEERMHEWWLWNRRSDTDMGRRRREVRYVHVPPC